MPVTYTNRKGHTYYLCKGMTKTGKLRYYFAHEPKDRSPNQIPEGYRVSESINGVVSLIKDRPQVILPQEVASVEATLGVPYRTAQRYVERLEEIDILREVTGHARNRLHRADEILQVLESAGR